MHKRMSKQAPARPFTTLQQSKEQHTIFQSLEGGVGWGSHHVEEFPLACTAYYHPLPSTLGKPQIEKFICSPRRQRPNKRKRIVGPFHEQLALPTCRLIRSTVPPFTTFPSFAKFTTFPIHAFPFTMKAPPLNWVTRLVVFLLDNNRANRNRPVGRHWAA